MSNSPVCLVGILNVTPDSFSDGGDFECLEDALKQADKLIADGAELIEVGGDSTRPGSSCAGPILEKQRILPIVAALSSRIEVAVDTHHAEVAEAALKSGAMMINDVMAGADPKMFSVIANSAARIVLMNSRCNSAHHFGASPQGDIIEQIKKFLLARVSLALEMGITAKQIILDPGLGAFLSDDPSKSFEVIERFEELLDLGFPLMFACSRKGFLKQSGEVAVVDRDQLSAEYAKQVVLRIGGRAPLLIRAHNVELHSLVLAD